MGRRPVKPLQLEAKPLSDSEVKNPPKELSKAAGDIWSNIAPMLVEDGRLSMRTRDAFVRYCKLAALFDSCYDFVSKLKSPIVESDLGVPKLNPSIQALKCYETMVTSLADRFLMTPKSLTLAGLSAITKKESVFSRFDKKT